VISNARGCGGHFVPRRLRRAPAVVLACIICATDYAEALTSSIEWPSYAADTKSTRYSPVSQISVENVRSLAIAWTWKSPDDALAAKVTSARPGQFKGTPLMVDDRLFMVTALGQVAALDPTTGKTQWLFNPKAYKSGRLPPNTGWQHRGVAYWKSGDDRRVLLAAGNGELIELAAETGMPIPSFGIDGRIDLLAALAHTKDERRQIGFNSPPVVVGDVVVVGPTIDDDPKTPRQPAGHLQAFDVRTGKRKWVFHTVPQNHERGVESWQDESWRYTGAANVWGPFSADPELGIVYAETGTSTNDYYGGHRKGDDLFAESLLAIRSDSGKLLWYFQGVHHGLWDYDFCAAPVLIDIRVDGKPVHAVAEVSKQGFTYVFDRVSGKPIWPIEERPVPQSAVPGEQSSPTQPFPTKPPPFARQGISTDDLIDFTPELRAQALQIVSHYKLGPLFTPPILAGEDGKKGVIQVPSAAGGANWAGAAADPDSGYLYVESANLTLGVAVLVPGDTAKGESRFYTSWEVAPRGPQGLPLLKPPYGTITAIDLNTGEIAWQIAHGDGPRFHPAIAHLNLPPLGASSHGWLSSGGPLVTKTLLFINQAQTKNDGSGALSDSEFYMRAFDKRTGAIVWEYKMEEPPLGSPMTYQINGKQYLVVGVGGAGLPAKLVAFALPD